MQSAAHSKRQVNKLRFSTLERRQGPKETGRSCRQPGGVTLSGAGARLNKMPSGTLYRGVSMREVASEESTPELPIARQRVREQEE
jgi:hypothetical protein